MKVPSGISFPLPKMAMIIPFINAFWNSTKGPSDTMTLLLDSCKENLGIRSPQSVTVARLFGLLAIAFHRSAQISTSKDPSTYGSMESYRNAASHRFTFQKSISTIIHCLQEEFELIKSTPTLPSPPPIPVPPTPPRRITTRNTCKAKHVTWQNKVKTGDTPVKGRKPSQGNEKT